MNSFDDRENEALVLIPVFNEKGRLKNTINNCSEYFQNILIIHDEKINFFEYFSLLRERTGSHVPRGELFSKNINIPKNIDNFDLNKYIYSFFYN